MDLHRLRPISLSQAEGRHRGRCAACGELLGRRREVVNLYGEVFHDACVFHGQDLDGAPQHDR
jgi:hypothetical protein